MKRNLIFIGLIFISLFSILIIIFQTNTPTNQQHIAISPVSPTESFIIEHLLAEDGTIRTDFSWVEKTEGPHRLSESIGLWLMYLYLKEDHEAFERTVQSIKQNFLLDNDLIAWQIYKGEQANTNALIDDLRIIRALILEGEKEDRNDYLLLAKKMFKAIVKYHHKNQLFVDFYDGVHKYANDSLTLSYLNIYVFEQMNVYRLFSEDSLNRLRLLMKETPLDNDFFLKHTILQTKRSCLMMKSI